MRYVSYGKKVQSRKQGHCGRNHASWESMGGKIASGTLQVDPTGVIDPGAMLEMYESPSEKPKLLVLLRR